MTSSTSFVAHSANSRKRSLDAASQLDQPLRSSRRKLSQATPSPADSSEPSVSNESALVPTSHSSGSTAASELEEEDSSELSESSSDPSSISGDSESDSEEDKLEDAESISGSSDGAENKREAEDGIITLPLPQRKRKPIMKDDVVASAGALRARLKNFLPQMAAANQELEEERRTGKLAERMLETGEKDKKEGDGEEQYIEMNLGLGVLEEKDPNASGSDNSSDASDDEDAAADAQPSNETEKDILGKLMGQDRRKEDVGIQVVDDA